MVDRQDMPDARTKDAHLNVIDAAAAETNGLSLAPVELLKDLVVVRLAEALTDIDYNLLSVGEVADDLESCIRLEVSGTELGSSRSEAW